MKTFFPLEKSPLLWASICTGVRPEVHGIANFVKGQDQEPVHGSAWRAPALWDILGAAGLSTVGGRHVDHLPGPAHRRRDGQRLPALRPRPRRAPGRPGVPRFADRRGGGPARGRRDDRPTSSCCASSTPTSWSRPRPNAPRCWTPCARSWPRTWATWRSTACWPRRPTTTSSSSTCAAPTWSATTSITT